MGFTRVGPFLDGGAPYLSAATLNTLEAGAAAGGTVYSIDATTTGIDWTGTTDSSTTINAILTAVPTGRYGNVNIQVPPGGKLRIDNTVMIDLAKAGLTVTGGALTFDASHINTTNGIALQVTASAAPPDNAGYGGPRIGPFRVTGPGSSNTGTVGILLSATSASGGQVRGVVLDSVSVEYFGTGHKYGDNVYNTTFLNAHVKGNTTGVWGPSGATNSGERITYIGSTISDGTVGIQNDANFRFHLSTCSIDYNSAQQVINNGGGTIELFECHVEKLITQSSPWFQLAGGMIKMIGGTVTGGGTYNSGTAPTYIVENDSTSTWTDGVAIFDGVTFDNQLQAASGFFGGGTGPVIIRRHTRTNQYQQAFVCTSAVMNLLSRGNFDAGTSLTDRWILNTDTATISSSGWTSSTISGSNGTLTTSTTLARSGTRSLKITKTGAASTALSFAVLMPIERASSVGGLGYLARTATLSGTFAVVLTYCTVSGDDTHLTQIGQTSPNTSLTIDTTSTLAAANTWYAFTTSVRRAPAWASHVALIFDLTSMGAGDIYIDDLCVTDS